MDRKDPSKCEMGKYKFETKLLGFCEVVILSLLKFKEAFQTSVGKMYYRQTQKHTLKDEKLSSDPVLHN